MRATLSRIASRIANRSTSGAFDRWAEAVLRLRRVRATSTRIVSRIANRSISGAFAGWTKWAREFAALRVKVGT